MSKINSEQLREYLLGTLTEGQDALEERLMTDDEVFELLQAEEEELVQNYADEELSEEEETAFESHFLISEERQQKVEFARAFRAKIDSGSAESPTGETSEASKPAVADSADSKSKPKKPPGFGLLRGLFASPFPAAASIIVIAGLATFFVWNSYFRVSDNDVALASLNKAFSKERPLKSRISGFDYAPKVDTRGDAESKLDSVALDRAGNLVFQEASENPSAKSFHALGRYYLSKGEFDKAIGQFEQAETLAPDNVQNINDLGVAFAEKANLAPKDTGQEIKLRAKAIEMFDRAIKKAPQMLEPRFNRASVLEYFAPEEALKSWEDYLKRDPDSGWSKEARKRLKALVGSNLKELTSVELENKFLEYYANRNEKRAIELIRDNRELIREKYLPQKLAMSFVESDGPKKDLLLGALEFLGQIESKHDKDKYAADLAGFYKRASRASIELSALAQIEMRKGYAFCKRNEFLKALESFQTARKLFESAGNFIEAKTVASSFEAYCRFYTSDENNALELFQLVNRYSLDRDYRWMKIYSSYWLNQVRDALGVMNPTRTNKLLRADYINAERMDDLYMMQQLLLPLMTHTHFVRSDEQTLSYLSDLLILSKTNRNSVRQKARNLSLAAEILKDLEYFALSSAIISEGYKSADLLNDELFLVTYQVSAGEIFAVVNDFEESKRMLNKAISNAETVKDSRIRSLLIATAQTQLGNVEKKSGRLAEAIQFYDKAIDQLNNTAPASVLEARSARLSVLIKLRDDHAIESELRSCLQLVEAYRSKILVEQERLQFFNQVQGVFDLAIEYQYDKGNFENAFNLAEKSKARSLLNRLSKPLNNKLSDNSPGAFSVDTTTPIKLIEIKSKIPIGAQVVQFVVLPEKTLIWLVERGQAKVVAVNIFESELNNLVGRYRRMIQSKRSVRDPNFRSISKKLYEVLIGSIARNLNPQGEIIFVPDKALFSLPFATLLTQDNRYLVSKFAISYAPSTNVFLISTKNGKGRTISDVESFLGIGNPAFDAALYEGLSELPHAREEVIEIAKVFRNSNVLTGENATKDNLLRRSANSDVIHFAGHYVVSEGAPLDSGLLFAGGGGISEPLLTNEEISSRKFPRTRLVVLSACDTGSETFLKGEGLIGLSRTFLAAGVPIVVGSQWQVESLSTAELMISFHRNRRERHLATARALQLAQNDVLENTKSEFAAPYYWGAFGVYGGAVDY